MAQEYLSEIEQKIKSEDLQTVEELKKEISDPLTEEFCESFLQQYVETGKFYVRKLKMKSEKERGKDTLGANVICLDNTYKTNVVAMNEALKIVIDAIKKGRYFVLRQIDERYTKDILSNLDSLEQYLEDGLVSDNIKNFLDNLYSNCYSIETMFASDFTNLDFLYGKNGSNHFRFYMNMPVSEETLMFCRDYQILCQRLGVPFTMKEFKNAGTSNKDVTIFYSTVEDLPVKISILKELMKVYSGMQLGSIPSACATIKGLPNIGFCNNGICSFVGEKIKNHMTYNDMIDSIFKSVFTHFIGNFVLTSPNFSEKTKNKFKNFKEAGVINNSRKSVGLYDYIDFNGEETEIVKEYMRSILQDPLRKKSVISFFMNMTRVIYNINNGFSDDYVPNIAFDSWYVEFESKKRMQK